MPDEGQAPASSAAARSEPAPASAVRTESAPPTPDAVRRVGRGELVVGAVVVVAILVGAGVLGWRQLHGTPAPLDVAGAPIANATAVLSDAEDELRHLAELDGAPLPDRAGCWFAPPAARASRPGPRVACGPVLLGIAGDDERWLVGSVQFSVAADPGGTQRATGAFRGFDGVENLRPALLRHPDAVRPPDEQPAPGTAGLRTEGGRVVTGLHAALTEADAAFRAAARTSGASVDPSARCFAAARQATRAGAPVLISTEQVWCGPVYLTDSGPDEFWATYSLSHASGDSIVEATVRMGTVGEVRRTTARPADVVLHREDGTSPPVDPGGLVPPDPDPVAPGTVRLLGGLPGDLDLDVPDDGRLITPVVGIEITGLARVPRVGTGAAAVVAPVDEELVVVTFAAARPDDAPSGTGTATVVAGAVRLPVPGWQDVGDGSVLIASVPRGADDVTLDVLFDERTQRISLLTGERRPGYPPVLYRERTTVGVGHPLTATVQLPGGESARGAGAVARADLRAWLPTEGWAPRGRAFLAVMVEDWVLTSPCCDVADLDVTTRWELVLPDGTTIRATGDAPGESDLLFDVPEDLTDAELRLTLIAEFTADGEPERVTARGSVDLELPS